MRRKFTDQEIQFIVDNYSAIGPKKVAEVLKRTVSSVFHKGSRLGLQRTIAAGNIARKDIWKFSGVWSYDLGYIIGVYLGDGNIRLAEQGGGYFRLSTIDKDFCLATQHKIYNEIGKLGSIRLVGQKNQYLLTVCNVDFCRWLVTNFGSANLKRIKLLPSLGANKGMLEGLIDSEGTVDKYTISIRMNGDLQIIANICDQLGIRRGSRHQGVRKEKWQGPDFQGYSISIKEYNRVGLGTYIKRKTKTGLNYKLIDSQECWGLST